MKRVKVQVFSLLLLAACSGPKVEGEQVLKPFLTTLCQARVACQPALEGQEATCVELLEKAYQNRPPLTTGAKKLDRCLQAIKTAPCEELYGVTPLKECDF